MLIILTESRLMKKIETFITVDIDNQIKQITNNKAEFFRQAISEKLARDKTSKSDNADGKEFMEVMKSLQKSMTENTKILANIPDMIKAHESKTMKVYIKNNDYVEGMMCEIYKINMIATESAGFDFIKENRAAIQIEANGLAKEFMERHNG